MATFVFPRSLPLPHRPTISADMSFFENFQTSSRTRFWAALCAVAALALLLWLTIAWSIQAAVRDLRLSTQHKLSLYSQVLDSEIRRHQFLPLALSRNKPILELLADQNNPALQQQINRYLADVSQRTRASAVYLMNAAGLTLASSNWDQPGSYIGNNYGFRPYFQAALKGGPGHYFAVGATTRTPGLFLSYPVEIHGNIAGVVALKVAFDPLEQAWAQQSAETVVVTDADGVVIVCSEPGWKFHALAPLSPERRQALVQSRQFMNYELPALGLSPTPWLWPLNDAVRVGTPMRHPRERALHEIGLESSFLVQSQPLPDSTWTLHIFAPMTPVARELGNALAIFWPTALVLVLLVYFLLEHRFHTLERQAFQRRTLVEQEERILERTAELRQSNELLRREILERRRAEEILHETQNDLIQASKLAALGQLAAGLAHELNQPLAAIRTFSASGMLLLERGQQDQAGANFTRIRDLTERMAKLTSQLKSFARKSSAKASPVSLGAAVRQALDLVEPQLSSGEIVVKLDLPEEEILVLADQHRLEQVLINLLTNAADAMRSVPERRLRIAARVEERQVWLTVADSGGGMAEAILPQIFDPFFTTKEVGEGLGLGLSISYGMVQDWGGILKARNIDGGAEFTIELPRCRSGEGNPA